MAGVSAGSLDREVTLQQLTESKGTSGFPVESWTTLEVEQASRRDLSGEERFRSGQLSAKTHTIWNIHYREDMDPEVVDVPKKRRLSYGGRSYDIIAARQIGRNEQIELTTLVSTRV